MDTDRIKNKDQALDMVMKISRAPRSGWIKAGNRAKSNEKIELSRDLANELASKTLNFYLTVEMLPGDPFCDCEQVERLLLKANQELPAGDTADEYEQLVFNFCPVCGKKFDA